MNRKATLIAVISICCVFAAVLAIRLLLLSSVSGISISVSAVASEEELMTPGKGRYQSEKEIPVTNINTCTEADLERLPGIGPSLAESIISYRSRNGKFTNPQDIMNVPGIGDGIFEQIKNYIITEE